MSNIYDLIQQKANNHEDPVPTDAWEQIRKKKRKKRPAFFWMFASVLLVGLLMGGYWYFNQNTAIDNKVSISKEDKLYTQPADPATNIQNKTNETNNTNDTNGSAAPVQPANQNAIPDNETKGTNTTIAGNNDRDIQNNPSANKLAKRKDDIQQVTSSRPAQKTKTIKNKVAATQSNYGPVTSEAGTAPSTANRKKIVKKDRAKSSIDIFQGETDELANRSELKKDSPVTLATEPGNQHNDGLVKNEEKKEPLSQPLAIEKNIVAEDVQKKAVATPVNENKKQDKSNKQPESKHPWFIDVTVTPVIPVQQHTGDIFFDRKLVLNDSKADFTGGLERSHIDPSIAYSVSIGKELNKKFSAGIGLQYLRLKEHVSIEGTQTNTYYKYIVKQVILDEGPGFRTDTIKMSQKGNRKFSAINSYRFLSIPVYVQYKIMQQKPWSIAATAGININVYSRYNNNINLNPDAVLTNTSQTLPASTSISYALVGALRVERTLHKQFSIFASPSFNYVVGKQDIKNSLFNTKIHQFGVGIGLSYKLK